MQVDTLFAAMSQVSVSDKPPSIFQCQLKLFNQWYGTWPPATQQKLFQSLSELDTEFMVQLNENIFVQSTKISWELATVQMEVICQEWGSVCLHLCGRCTGPCFVLAEEDGQRMNRSQYTHELIPIYLIYVLNSVCWFYIFTIWSHDDLLMFYRFTRATIWHDYMELNVNTKVHVLSKTGIMMYS